MGVKSLSAIPGKSVAAGNKATIQILISPDESPNFAMRKFTIHPGGSMPEHSNSVEHEQFILNGSAEITIGERTYVVSKNDIVFIPSGIKHSYKNTGPEPFEFLCMVPNRKDIIKLTGK